MSGSITSSTIRSGLNAVTADSASAPVPAASTVKPWKRRAIEMTSTMLGSSSTTSTRWEGEGAVEFTPASIATVACEVPERNLCAMLRA